MTPVQGQDDDSGIGRIVYGNLRQRSQVHGSKATARWFQTELIPVRTYGNCVHGSGISETGVQRHLPVVRYRRVCDCSRYGCIPYNNKHWLGDVFFGAGLGMLCTKLAYHLYPSVQGKLFKKKKVADISLYPYYNGQQGGLLVKYDF